MAKDKKNKVSKVKVVTLIPKLGIRSAIDEATIIKSGKTRIGPFSGGLGGTTFPNSLNQ